MCNVLFLLIYALAFCLSVASASFCDDKTGQNNNLPKRYFSQQEVIKNISLYWGSEPSYAASALLAIILRHKIGYQHVRLVEGPHDLPSLIRTVPYDATQKYNEVILAISTAWEPSHGKPKSKLEDANPLEGSRLYEFGVSSVPARQQLHVHLIEKYQSQEKCRNVNRWSFYSDTAALEQCGFSLSEDDSKNVVVFDPTLADNYTLITMKKLEERAEIHLQFKTINRTSFFQMLRTGNQSFLFVDYDIWSGHPNISIVQPPPCIPGAELRCSQELDTAIAMSVGDVPLLREYASELYQVAHNFIPTPETVREILELHSEGTRTIEEAACEWVSKHNTAITPWIRYKPSKIINEITVFYCNNDHNFSKYDDLLRVLGVQILPTIYRSVSIRFRRYGVNCNDAYVVKNILNYYMSLGIRNKLIGAVVGGVKNVTDVIKTIDGSGFPVLLYDAPGINADTTISTWITSGRMRHLALAVHRFLGTMDWIRVGVISEPTATAKQFVDDLRALNDSVAFGNHVVKLNLTQLDAETILMKLKEENAHIILINTNYKDAVTILLAGAKLKMNLLKDYAWIVREWRPNDTTSDICHFTFTFSTLCDDDVPSAKGSTLIREKMRKIWGNCSSDKEIIWPALGTALADAILTLVHGLNFSIHKNPYIRDDLHTSEAIRLFEKNLVTMPVQGATQKLTYKGHSLEETLVFLHAWYGNRHQRLARLQVNTTAVSKWYQWPQWDTLYPFKIIPDDGVSSCIVYSGDLYLPTCYDTLLVSILVSLVLAAPTIMVAYRIVSRRLKEQQKRLICELLTQRQQRAAALSAGYLVDRSALTIFQELGSGRFGFVRLAVLRIPGCAPKYVAVKSLREHQEESEILREACTLASLNHENIIRLVGVCIDKDPPLVLMDVAFFGDLLQYLRDRRYLADGADSDLTKLEKTGEEAIHISAEALTRLAIEAASALGYLSLRGIIHRDIRASNCLVDANRSLKLADFGLARATVAKGLDGGTEYACRRRGLFPVLWMAPESLVHGVFSAASDVWALGVLVLELVTLGARPFGDMSPLHVMQFVAAGGKPPMPRDATPETIGLTRLCSKREPDLRPTAADVVTYLTERPSALRPALDCDYDQPADVDSGYGESPMLELLPC